MSYLDSYKCVIHLFIHEKKKKKNFNVKITGLNTATVI